MSILTEHDFTKQLNSFIISKWLFSHHNLFTLYWLIRSKSMYTEHDKFKNAVCEYCGDPAKIVKRYKESFFPYRTKSITAFCYECYLEIKKNKLPLLTDSPYQSKHGTKIKKRERYY